MEEAVEDEDFTPSKGVFVDYGTKKVTYEFGEMEEEIDRLPRLWEIFPGDRRPTTHDKGLRLGLRSLGCANP